MALTHEHHVVLDAFAAEVRDTLGAAVAVLSVAAGTGGSQQIVGSAGLPTIGLGAVPIGAELEDYWPSGPTHGIGSDHDLEDRPKARRWS
jgi:hypothetical protein